MRFFDTPKEKSTALMHMGKLGVLELKDRCYRELSGGQMCIRDRSVFGAEDLVNTFMSHLNGIFGVQPVYDEAIL